jgi:glycosyltransferase involved in cell wall biosynthesis
MSGPFDNICGSARIALLFRSYGPYHLARLKAARSKASVLALEFAEVDSEYDWNVADQKRRACVVSLSTTNRRHDRNETAKLRNLLRDFSPHAVAIPGYGEPQCLNAARLCRDLGIPSILMSDSHVFGRRRHSFRELLKRSLISLFDAAFVAGTPHKEYLACLGFRSEKIALGYDVVDNKHFSSASTPGTDKAKYNRLQNYFFCCSRLVEGKNIHFLIDAFRRYRQSAEANAWNLVIAGDGPLYESISQYVASLSLTAYVHLIGRKTYDELPPLYMSAGAFVFPSSAETWGLVVNEAMAAGLPVLVSSAVGCHMDLVEEGINGHIFDPTDTAGLAVLLSKIANAPDRNAMGNASQRIIRHWDLDRFASGLITATSMARMSRVTPHSATANAIATALSYRC